jgi:hypothetical protein
MANGIAAFSTIRDLLKATNFMRNKRHSSRILLTICSNILAHSELVRKKFAEFPSAYGAKNNGNIKASIVKPAFRDKIFPTNSNVFYCKSNFLGEKFLGKR